MIAFVYGFFDVAIDANLVYIRRIWNELYLAYEGLAIILLSYFMYVSVTDMT